MKRPQLLLSLLALLLFFQCANKTDVTTPTIFQFEEMTIVEMQEGYKNGQFSVQEVAKAYLDRIKAIDPKLNSVLTINPEAMKIAEQLDQELKEGKVRGNMHGIPVLLKDNIDTGDKMPTTAGSRALKGSIAPQDSWVAAKLRESGALILGKTNLSEWANFRSNKSSSGWSGLGGQVNNPYDLTRNPCGSSSGSGAAVSANLCMVAIGTETDGSIVCPSHANGIVGIKPTVGLVSRAGIIPISETQDTGGPMARTVADAAACLSALTGIDERDTYTNASKGNSHNDYTTFLKKEGLKGKRIGVYTKIRGWHDGVDKLANEAIELIKAQGAEVVEIEQINPEEIGAEEYQVLVYEFKDGLNKYFASLGKNAPIKNLEDLMEFNKNDEIESTFDQGIIELAVTKGDLTSPEYLEAKAKMHLNIRTLGIDKVMNEQKLDAIIAPTGSPAWKTDHINGDHYLGGSSSPAAMAGYPNIAVPMGSIGGLPVGLSFFGRAWSEGVLIEIAYAYEQASGHRIAPNLD